MAEANLPRGAVPPGTYARGARSPVVYALLCPSCAGYAPTVHEDYPPLPQCQGCGAYVREVHRFQALIMSAANGGCRCTIEHPQVAGDLPTGDSLGAVYLELATRPMSPVQRSERDEAADLLERVLFLRQNGERAPGGNETWQPLDRDVEVFLRRARGMMEP